MASPARTPGSSDVPDARRWNRNIHYHRLLVEQLPPAASQVLDVGCGDGMLVRQLSKLSQHVTGIDNDAQSIVRAKALTTDTNATFVLGDVMMHPLANGSFDAVFSVATLHHLDTGAALHRLACLLKPGGVLGIIGIGRPDMVRDLPWQVVGVLASTVYRFTKPMWEHPSPIVWPPAHTNRDVERIAAALLPGCRFRQHILWRYSLLWIKPDARDSVDPCNVR